MTPTALGERVEDNNTGGGEQERRVPDKGLDIMGRPIMKYTKTNYPKNTFILGEAVLALVFGAVAIGLYDLKVPVHVPVSPLVKAQELPEVKEEPKQPSPSEKQQILAYIVEKFGDDADKMITIIGTCENGTWDQTRTNTNRNGTKDWGIGQVNDANEKLCSGLDFRNSWKDNVDCMKRIKDSQGFSAWACSHKVGIKPFYAK